MTFTYGQWEGETDVLTAHVILDDETNKKQPEKIKQLIKRNTSKTSYRTLDNRNRKPISLFRYGMRRTTR